MPRKDDIHEAVRNALIKDGWTIINDPFRLHYMDVDLYADLRVEKTDAENVGRRALVIEIKSFIDPSAAHALENALGQYEFYRTLLRRIAPQDTLYLAVSDAVYADQFARPSFQLIVQEHQINLVVVNLEREEIMAWIASRIIAT